MMPKLTKKHRTFDCDLSSSILTTTPQQQQQQQHRQQQPQPLLTQTRRPMAMPNNDESNRYHDGPPTPSSSSMISNEQCLSKLVLSSSMHQLADSKFHTNRQHRDHNNHQNLPDSTTPDSTNNIIPNMSNNPAAAAADDNAIRENNTLNEHNNGQIDATTTKTLYSTNKNNNNTHLQQNANIDTQTQITTKSNHAPPLSRQQRDANLDTVHVVVGNESCDLDSAVSCLLMFHIISKMSDEINGKDKSRTLYIPLLNTTRDMLDGKCEVLWFLQKTLNIDKSFLTCKDDIDWNEIKKNGVEVLITLVDHNYNEEFKDIGKIVEIIDHHQVQNPEWLMENHANIRLTLDTSVGSCTTLVAERLFYIYAEHHVSDEILMLIYGTVLLDTICLSEKAKRFTRRDVYLLRKLDYLLGSKKPVRDQLYKQLVDVKNSFRELSFEKLMKRDLKVYKDKSGQRVGIASLFGMAAHEALGLAANIDLDAFFQQNQYEAFILMGLIADLEHSDSISRDLVLISANSRLFEDLRSAFEADTSKLDLQPIGSDSSPDPEDNIINKKRIVDSSNDCGPLYKARIWLQRNVSSSRKVVAPLVLKVLHDNSAMQ